MQLVTPQDVRLHVRIEEDGATPIENARIKALAYYRSARIPTVAFDSGLYFLDLKEDDPLQPKTHVRRVQGRELNDEEMISYYRRIAADYGGRLLSAYRNGVCVVYDEQHIYTYMEDMETARDFAFYLCDTPHEQRTPGWPLDSISIDEKTMKYFHDMADTEYAAAGEDENALPRIEICWHFIAGHSIWKRHHNTCFPKKGCLSRWKRILFILFAFRL